MARYTIGDDEKKEQRSQAEQSSQKGGNSPNEQHSTPSKKGKGWKNIIICFLVVICVGLLISYASNLTNVEELRADITIKDNEISKLEKQIDELEQENEASVSKLKKDLSSAEESTKELETELEYYKNIVTEAKSLALGKLGYYSDLLRADKSVIFVKKGETKSITVYCGFSGGYTINGGTTNNNATLINWAGRQFQNNKLTCSVKGVNVGTSVIEFYNASNSAQKFKVLVVIEE